MALLLTSLLRHNYLRRQMERRDREQFAALIATPAVGSFRMPANGRMRFVATAGAAAGDLAATLTGSAVRLIRTPLLAAGGSVKIERIEHSTTVDPEAGFDVELDVGQGVWRKIAEGA